MCIGPAQATINSKLTVKLLTGLVALFAENTPEKRNKNGKKHIGSCMIKC